MLRHRGKSLGITGRHSEEEKIRIVVEGLFSGESIASVCRRNKVSVGSFYTWQKKYKIKSDTFDPNKVGLKDLQEENLRLKEAFFEFIKNASSSNKKPKDE